MDIKQLWLNVKDLWNALDEHPLLHSSLGLLVLLVVAMEPSLILFLFFLGYSLSGYIMFGWRRLKRRQRQAKAQK